MKTFNGEEVKVLSRAYILGKLRFLVYFINNPQYTMWINPTDLKENKMNTFKDGDKVRVKDPKSIFYNRTGEISEEEYRHLPKGVYLVNFEHGQAFILESLLELVKQEETFNSLQGLFEMSEFSDTLNQFRGFTLVKVSPLSNGLVLYFRSLDIFTPDKKVTISLNGKIESISVE